MKSIISAVFLFGSTLIVSAQTQLSSDTTQNIVVWKNKYKKQKALGDTLYYEDFDSTGRATNNFLPIGWTSVDNTGQNHKWIWSNQAPGGQYSSATAPLNSTSGANGFLSLPSDFYNTSASMFINMNAAVSSPSIPIPQKGAWLLQFQQSHRYCCVGGDSVLVAEVSTDGQTWTAFDATFNRNPNSATRNPHYAEINVSSVLAFEDTAYIRFRQTGPSHYYWMIDDVALVEGPSNAFQVNEMTLNFSDTFSVNPIYTQVPLSMVDSISVKTIVENTGAFDQTGFRIDYLIYQDSTLSGASGSGLVFQDSIVYSQAFPAFSVDTLTFDHPKFKPTQSGYYRAEIQLKSDSVNQIAYLSSQNQTFVVSDSILARDRGIYIGSFRIFTGFGNAYSDSNKVGVLINSGQTHQDIRALRFFVSNLSTNSGVKIRPMLWEIDLNLDSSLNSSIHLAAQDTAATTITQAMLGSWIQIPFSTDPTLSDLTLDPGKQYVMGWEQINGANGLQFEVGRDREMEKISPNVSNFVFVNNQNPRWVWITSVPAVRAVIETSAVGLSQKEKRRDWQVFPNPNQGHFQLKRANPAAFERIEVRNLKGQLISRHRLSGDKLQTFNFTDWEAGIYLISLIGEEAPETQKLIIH